MLYLVLLILLGVSAPSWAAITYDTACSGEGTTSATCDSTVAADANIAIVCVAVRDSGGAVAAVSSVSVEGAAATYLTGQSHSGGVIRSELWYKLAPATGANVTASATADASTEFTIVGMMTFKNVAQSGTFNAASAGDSSSTNLELTAIASAVGELGVLCGAWRDNDATASPDAGAPTSTERFERQHATATSISALGYTEDGATTSIAIQADLTSSKQWAASGVSMRELAVSVRRPISPLLLQ